MEVRQAGSTACTGPRGCDSGRRRTRWLRFYHACCLAGRTLLCSLHCISDIFYEDRRPALLLYNDTTTSKAAVLSRATATANAAMTTFMAAHYKSKLRQGRVRTSAATVTNQWITRRLSALHLCAPRPSSCQRTYRQPQTDANVHRQCPHYHILETVQHTCSACGRYLNQRRLWHDHAITAILPHLKSAATRFLSRATWVRE